MANNPLSSLLARGRRGPTFPAQNPLNEQSYRSAQNPPIPVGGVPNNPAQVSPLFGRPGWTYVQPVQAPRLGPQPRLAQGTGRTAGPVTSGGGYEPVMPGFVVQPDYEPPMYDYQGQNNQRFTRDIPRTIHVGDDGLHALNPTYKAYDVTHADRFFHQDRQVSNWQSMMYPPDFRNLLAWQQVMRYRIQSQTVSARPLDSSNYFLGYQVNPQMFAQSGIGQNTLGYMGSS